MVWYRRKAPGGWFSGFAYLVKHAGQSFSSVLPVLGYFPHSGIQMESKTVTAIPPNNIESTAEQTVDVQEGEDHEWTTEVAHVAYKDLTQSIKVYLPANDITVNVPSSKVGMAAAALVPAAMLHGMVQARIAEAYKKAKGKGSSSMATPKQLKELTDLLKTTNAMMSEAWEMGQASSNKLKGTAPSLQPLMNGIVNIQNAHFEGKSLADLNIEDVVGKIQAIDIEAIDKEVNKEANLEATGSFRIHKDDLARIEKKREKNDAQRVEEEEEED